MRQPSRNSALHLFMEQVPVLLHDLEYLIPASPSGDSLRFYEALGRFPDDNPLFPYAQAAHGIALACAGVSPEAETGARELEKAALRGDIAFLRCRTFPFIESLENFLAASGCLVEKPGKNKAPRQTRSKPWPSWTAAVLRHSYKVSG
jgi:hypothetical protein